MKRIKPSEPAIKRILVAFAFSILVSACNNLGDSSATTTTGGPTKSVKLNWTAATGVITGYKIEQSTDNTTFKEVQTIGNTTTATLTGLIPGSTYYFRVKAYNAGGESSASTIASVSI